MGTWAGGNGSSSRWRKIRAIVLADNPPCALCGLPGADSADHKVPVSLGGAMYEWSNIQAAHLRCNVRKGARTTERPRATPMTDWSK